MTADPRSLTRSGMRRVALVIVLTVGLGIVSLDRLLPPDWLVAPEYSLHVLDRDGEGLRLYATSDGYLRLPVRPVDVDPGYLKMLFAFEDARFRSHLGVDPLALMRALWQALSHGRIVSGASTLSMQTARLLQPHGRTLAGKLGQMFRALQMEARLSKDEILSLYLTLAPYGGNIQGIRAASLLYFGKEPSYLTPAEAALLVALPQSPERRRPDRAPAQARGARDFVLQQVAAAGVLGMEQWRSARNQGVPEARRPLPMTAPHLADRLRAQGEGAHRMVTTLDGALQRRVERLLSRHQGGLAEGVTLAALVVDNRSAEVLAYVGSGDYLARGFPGQVDMVTAVRSPGSALKPFIYGMAFDAGFLHPETLVADRPGPVSGYAPGNFDGRYHGEISVREALRLSRNVPAVKVLDRLGPSRFVNALSRAGVALRLPVPVAQAGLPVALGGVGIRLEELVSLYAGLAGDGLLRAPVLTRDQNRPDQTRMLSPAAAWYLTEILRGSPRPSGFVDDRRRVAFKTGTSYGFRDAWSVGYDRGYTVGVWVGRPDGGFTPGLSGLSAAAPVLLEIFYLLPAEAASDTPVYRPPGVVLAHNGELPPALQRLQPRFNLRAQSGAPHIDYPPEGSRIELTPTADRVQLEIRGGEAPFHWLHDGRFLATRDGRGLQWRPSAAGAVRLTVIDAKGRSDSVNFHVARVGG